MTVFPRGVMALILNYRHHAMLQNDIQLPEPVLDALSCSLPDPELTQFNEMWDDASLFTRERLDKTQEMFRFILESGRGGGRVVRYTDMEQIDFLFKYVRIHLTDMETSGGEKEAKVLRYLRRNISWLKLLLSEIEIETWNNFRVPPAPIRLIVNKGSF